MIRRILFAVSLFFILFGCTTSQPRSAEAPDFKLFFIVDRGYDKNVTLGMFYRSDDPAGLDNRARSAGIDPVVARKIHDAAQPSDVWELVDKLVEDRFRKEGEAIEASKEDLWLQWKDLLPLFSHVVIETTESPWVHPDYICVVSSMFPGVSDWSGNRVSVGFNLSLESRRRVLANEILLSDVFQLLRKRYQRSEISDWQVWAFSEITPVLILDDPRLRSFWPSSPRAGEYFSHGGYAQLVGLEKPLKELFDHRTSYIDYEDRAAQVLKSFRPFVFRWLGVSLGSPGGDDSYHRLATEMNLPGAGALVLGLAKGSPADRAGLMPGDFVTAVESTPIENAAQFNQVIRSLAAGEKTSVTLLRLGKPMTLSVTIGEVDVRNTSDQNLWPGFTVTEVPAGTEASRNAGGVAVSTITSEKSPAAVAGLRPGDLIKAVNGTEVENLMDFYRALNANGGRSASFVITREGKEMTLEL